MIAPPPPPSPSERRKHNREELRRYAAIRAMEGLLARPNLRDPKVVASKAVAYADALVAKLYGE